MPVTVTFDPTVGSKQSHVINDATPNKDGSMSKVQAAQLAKLAGSSAVATPYANAAAFPDSPVPADGTLALDQTTNFIAVANGGVWYEQGQPAAPIPVIDSFSVPSAAPGTVVVITGRHFIYALSFFSFDQGVTPAVVFSVDSPTQITATVPAGPAGTAPVFAQFASGAFPTTGPNFTVL